MKRTILACAVAVALSGSAWAQGQGKGQKPAEPPGQQAQAPGMDMSKMGPPARKPTNEKQTKKEIEDFFKKHEELAKKGSFDDMLAAVDFPVYMITDDMKGVPEAKAFSREEYTAVMKPMHESMSKDMKMTHKSNIVVLSDSLASVTDDYTMTMGKQKVSGRSASVLVKRDGQWKWKVMTEAGWGGMQPPQGAGGGQMAPEGKK